MDTAVESLIEADLVRCFPNFRKQTRFKQYLHKKEKILGKNKKRKDVREENPVQNKPFEKYLRKQPYTKNWTVSLLLI